ncbi:MAG: FtsQ-type POTRA domain-containing protein [Candidatus Acidoferrales bacterium]
MSGLTRSSGNRQAPADWENDDAARFRRPRRPVEVRRRAPWKRALACAGRVTVVVVAVGVLGGAGLLAHWFATTGAVFQVPNLEAIRVSSHQHVSLATVRQHFAADVGQSVFAIPLETRRQSLEEIVWVEAATVQRLLPNRLGVYLRERTPVAFVRRGTSLWLADAAGVLLPLPEESSYTFPVLTGLPETLPAEARRARVALYLEFLADLDSQGKNYSAQLSEIDLSDPANLRASVAEESGAVWLHFGRGRYREKFQAYFDHRSLWQESGDEVRAVDLRYRGQLVLNPELSPTPEAP